MRILHVIPGLAESSGPTQALGQMVAGLAARGHELTVVNIGDRLERQVRIDIPRVTHLELNGTPPLRHWGFSVQLHRYLVRHVTQFDVVHLHSMWLFPTLAAARAARRGRIPYIVRPAGSLEPWSVRQHAVRKRIYYAVVERGVVENAAVVHVVSEQEAHHVRQWGVSTPTRVVANGVDLDSLSLAPGRSEARQRLGIGGPDPTLLFLGRIHRKKGLDFLGGVMVGLLEALPTARLLVVGPDDDPEYVRRVKTQFSELGIAEHVEFLGERTGEERAVCYAAADVFVLPSHSENFGNVVIEALSVGIPVIASTNTPWEGLRGAGVGEWLELTENLWVQALLRLLEPAYRTPELVEKRRTFVQEAYSRDTLGHRLEQLYSEVVKGL